MSRENREGFDLLQRLPPAAQDVCRLLIYELARQYGISVPRRGKNIAKALIDLTGDDREEA